MRILVACEFSGIVRDEFSKLGHYVASCDLLPSEKPGEHFQGDVLEIINSGWDMMLAYPPCTYLCSSGLHWNRRIPGRQFETEEAFGFVMKLWNAPIEKVVIENPVGCLSTRWRKPDQIIQPWQFGHPESKATCLWKRNLPDLVPTNVLSLPPTGRWENQTPSGQNKLGPSPTRAMDRSRTYSGIAKAKAEQWGGKYECQ